MESDWSDRVLDMELERSTEDVTFEGTRRKERTWPESSITGSKNNKDKASCRNELVRFEETGARRLVGLQQ